MDSKPLGQRLSSEIEESTGSVVPSVLFGIGEQSLLGNGGLAIVGSRNLGRLIRSMQPRRAGKPPMRVLMLFQAEPRGVIILQLGAALMQRARFGSE